MIRHIAIRLDVLSLSFVCIIPFVWVHINERIYAPKRIEVCDKDITFMHIGYYY